MDEETLESATIRVGDFLMFRKRLYEVTCIKGPGIYFEAVGDGHPRKKMHARIDKFVKKSFNDKEMDR